MGSGFATKGLVDHVTVTAFDVSESTMDCNGGPETPFLSESDSDVDAIRGIMTQQRETSKRIDREIEKLAEKKKGIEEYLVRLGTAIATHNHNRLPNEVLSRIFILVAEDYGPVHFPTTSNLSQDPPPQFSISRVCSRWRRVALHTLELWSNTHLSYPEDLDQAVYFHHWRRWLMRAGMIPVTRLSIDFGDSCLDDGEIARVLQMILLPFRVKRLHLSLTYTEFMELSTLPEATLLDLTDLSLELDLTFSNTDTELNANVDGLHHLITRVRSLRFHGDSGLDVWLGKLSPALPWGQLQSLDLRQISIADLHPVIEILHQMPKLQVLNFEIYRSHIDSLQGLTLPSLRDLCLRVDEGMDDGTDLDAILHSFTCPSLVKLDLSAYGPWTVETFEIIKQQYNMQGLEEIKLDPFPLSISSILRNAPMLRSLSVGTDVILDDAAIMGLSSGTLGRFLAKLDLSLTIGYNVNEVICMVEKRMKTVDALIESGCSWREDITIIKDVVVHTAKRPDKDEQRESERVVAKLKEAGINIALKF